MIVTAMSKDRLYYLSLPEKVAGQYWVNLGADNSTRNSISIEGINNEWVVKSTRWVKILGGENSFLKSIVLSPMTIIPLQTDSGERSVIFIEPETDDRLTFHKYIIIGDSSLSIGRAPENDICFDFQAVSSNHASLVYRNRKWTVSDLDSRNGTYVNGEKVKEADLKIGDTVFIMGLKIIIGFGFIALNNPDGKVNFSKYTEKFQPQAPKMISEEEDEYELDEPEYFYRSPRFMRQIEKKTFKIDAPPQSPIANEMPFFLVMGSSVAMGMMSMTTLITAIITHNVMSMVMGGSMLFGTLLLPTITKIYEKHRKKKKEKKRVKKYREYLAKVGEQINEECQIQKEISCENNITVNECEERIMNTSRNLWERTATQNDFLRLRVGTGSGTLEADVTYPQKGFKLDEDFLEDELYELCGKPMTLHNIPITYSLLDDFISGIIGDRKSVIAFAKNLIIKLAALYSYDEVKFVFLFDENEADEWEFTKWLPHVWDEDKKFRYIATNITEAREVSAQLERTVVPRKELGDAELEDETPYYIVFAMSQTLAVRSEAIKQILAHKKNLRMSVVSIYEELRDLPKECSIVLEIKGENGRMFDKDDTSGHNTLFTIDDHLTVDPVVLSKKLLNTQLYSMSSGSKLPKMITFLQLFNVGKVEHLNPLARWKENDPTKSLEAAVGVDEMGELFKLDLHEKFHGPHGLVAGMTGSGKSEFIITYILSLAVNYHPNEVAFILIDYKGGGMAKSFEHLPHTAGIITNLDGGAIKRSLVSIESELKRRQAIFADASKKVGVSNIDIYKYQKLYREGTVEEPLQHLFIISDEFAELKTQQPEFMTQLVSAARIGRSLGVHLILATQKPSGVVDDQIWSNSRFRVCLKVQEKSDSQDMLKRPDAAELTDTGRFYLQVGYNELFEMGQSAWAGAPYYPSDRVQKEKDDSVVVVDTNGHPIREAKMDLRKAMFTNPKKQLDEITDYIGKIAEEEHIKIRPLWLDPIPGVILLKDIREKYEVTDDVTVLNPVIGEYDDPARQQQCLLRLPITAEGNVIVYGSAGAGKTTFLNAMIYSLIHEHNPEQVNLYILDFASETLRAFAKAPHVGDVILAHETEKVNNLFKLLTGETSKRKKLFADYGGDYASYIRSSGQTIPYIVVVIHNFAAFTEIYDEKEDMVSYLSREGSKYGIYFVLSALGVGSVRFRLLQNFKQLFCLQLNDEGDYSSVVGKTEGMVPSKFKGRGLVKRDNLYEFQIASLTDEDMPFTFIQADCRELRNNWSGPEARNVPILPDRVDLDFLKEYVKSETSLLLPIGVEKNSLNVHYFPFGNYYINMILSSAAEYQGFVTDLTSMISKCTKIDTVVFDTPKVITSKAEHVKVVSTAKECESAVDELFDILVHRNNEYKDAAEENRECEKFEQKLIIINSLNGLYAVLNDTSSEKLSLVLEKGAVEYNVTVIFADQAKSLSSVSFEKWFKAHISPTEGIWIGNGISEQYYLKPSKSTHEMQEDLTTEFGFSLTKGKAVKVKMLNEHFEEEADE